MFKHCNIYVLKRSNNALDSYFNPYVAFMEQISYPAQFIDISYGLETDADSDWKFFKDLTPDIRCGNFGKKVIR